MHTTKLNGTESSLPQSTHSPSARVRSPSPRNYALSSRLRRVPHIHVCLKVLRPRRTTPAPRCPRAARSL